ncbi:MAG TPA: 4-alpha-glucanotransferase [Stellaceae bacterium]|nr:4-alpha-glucanotransferase [Stellaceae bacterium]
MNRASDWGIETEYRDVWGALRTAPEATVARLLDALAQGAPVASDAAPDPVRPCFRPPWLAHDRAWGVAVQLYGLRSPRNWGIGDFTDLHRLVELASDAGADFVGVSPIHARYAADPSRISPYSPSSREFIDVLFIDPLAMRAYATMPDAHAIVADAAFQRGLAAMRNSDLIDYGEVARCKMTLFRHVFDGFRDRIARGHDGDLASDFARFRADRGDALRRFAIFQALSCQPGFGTDWRAWPHSFRDPASADVAQFAAANEREVLYHEYLQWEADAQLARCAAAARSAGMRIGLYLDLAVGTDPGSAESWSDRGQVIEGFHIGAPPDAWNEWGQDWGLAVPNPSAYARDGGHSYRRFLAAVMRHAGAIRIDHVLGLHRLFLVEQGGSARDGVYLRMPAHRVCQMLADESTAHRCIVIGENLGTVPEGFADLLSRYGIMGCALLTFAKDGPRFLSPQEYPQDVLVAISTHDLPPLVGFWSGADLDLRRALGLYPDEAAWQSAHATRDADRAAMRQAFAAAGLEPGDDMPGTAVAAHRFLARTPCRLFVVQMEDLAMERDQPNFPGTDGRNPNWRRKLGRDLDAIFGDERATAILDAIRAERPTGPRR